MSKYAVIKVGSSQERVSVGDEFAVSSSFAEKTIIPILVSPRKGQVVIDDKELKKSWQLKQMSIIHEAKLAYKWAIENGIAKEQARAILPEGLTVSRLYVNGTIRSWIHYIELRSGNGTQKEHMDLAKACASAINRIFPLAKDYVTE